MTQVRQAALILLILASVFTSAFAQEAPSNDHLANAIELTGTNAVTHGSNLGATRESNENLITPRAGGKTVWWTWVAPRNGTVSIHTYGSSFDTVVAIYRMYDDGLRLPLGSGDDSFASPPPAIVAYPLAAQAQALVTAGVRYYIGVDGHAGATGDIKLAVGLGTSGFGSSPPKMSAQPKSTEVGLGASLILQALVTGNPPLRVQWERNGLPIPDATNTTYSVSAASESDAGIYRLSVTNAFGSELSSEALVTVLPIAGNWLVQDPFIAFGQSNALTFVASGVAPIDYRWEKDGVPIAHSASNLVVQSLQTGSLGNYRVVASNSFGMVTSAVSQVTGVEPWTFVTLARLPSTSSPHGIILGTNGTLLVSDATANTILSVHTNGTYATIAGAGGVGAHADGPASQAKFNQPWGLCLDGSGNILVADTFNNVIRKITPDGTVSTFAGVPGVEGYIDGPGNSARFRWPAAVVAAPSGDVFVADYNNCVIRRIDPSGNVSTWAGKQRIGLQQGNRTPNSIDGPADHSIFFFPVGLALAPQGDLIVADEFNQALRRVSADRIVETIAGGRLTGAANGRGSDASFRMIHGPAIAPDGSIFIADYENNLIRKMDPTGYVVTIGGRSGQGTLLDGTGSGAAFEGPRNVVVGLDGCLYVADYDNHAIRKGIPGTTLALLTNATDRTAAVGSGANFGVRAVGFPTLRYQWFKDGEPLQGQASAILGLGQLQSRSQSGLYSAVISNNFQTITSPPVHLTVVVRQQILPPEPLPVGGYRLHFADETGDGLPPDLGRLELQSRDSVPTESDSAWQTVTNELRIQDGFIVVDLPADESPTNRFFRVVER